MRIGFSDLSDEYRSWLSEYGEECGDGACQLDLLKNGVSCFDDADCENWLTHPQRGEIFTCWYAGNQLALSDCFIYGPTFQSTGPAYGNPNDGSDVGVRTWLTDEDELTRFLLDRGSLVWGPSPTGFEAGLTDRAVAARRVAKQCIALSLEDDCRTLPIFSPGDNVKEAAVHDLDAIRGQGSVPWSAPAVLTRGNSAFPPGWYAGQYPCSEPYDAATLNCDEYPFYSTTESASPYASLRVIDRDDNWNEGIYLGEFYSRCNVAGDFVVVPVPNSDPDMNVRFTRTEMWCG